MAAGKHRRLLGLLLAGAAAGLSFLFALLRFHENAALWDRLLDALHFPWFAAATLIFFATFRPDHPQRNQRVFDAAVAALALACFIELFRPHFGHPESKAALAASAWGVGLAAMSLSWPRREIWVAAAGAAAVVAPGVFLPAVREFQAVHWRRSQFPLLGDFESAEELRLWVAPESPLPSQPNTRLKISTDFATFGKHSLEVEMLSEGWPGVRFLAEGQDWRGYAYLALDVYNPGPPFNLAVRIDDTESTGKGDRFSGSWSLATGWNHLQLPLESVRTQPSDRTLNMGAIKRLLLFVDGSERRVFYLDNVRLDQSTGHPTGFRKHRDHPF